MDRKLMYKLELVSVKYTPVIVSFSILIGLIFSYLEIAIPLIDTLFGASIVATIPMYISSYTYKFCSYHRMFIHYIVLVHLVDTCDILIGIPLDDFNLLILYLIITGIFLLLILYYHQKCKNK